VRKKTLNDYMDDEMIIGDDYEDGMIDKWTQWEY
jgi:hypothetical protein